MPSFLAGVLGCVGSIGCDNTSEWATVQLGLGPAPDRVETISVFVTQLEEETIVASATVTPPNLEVSLGLPAVQPLQITAVARTADLAPEQVGGTMPGWVGRVERNIPLSREVQVVRMTARRAGVLALSVETDRDVEIDEDWRIRLEGPALDRPPPRPWTVQSQTLYSVLQRGYWSASLEVFDDPDEVPEVQIEGGQAMWIEPETESVATVRIRSRARSGRPLRFTVQGTDASGAPLGDTLRFGPDTAVTFQLTATDDMGRVVRRPDAEVAWVAQSSGGALGPIIPETVGIPSVVGPISVRSPGRLSMVVRVVVPDGPRFSDRQDVNVLAMNEEVGPPDALTLELDDPAGLRDGTTATVLVVDADDRWDSSARGVVDLSGTDPWVFLPDGVQLPLSQGRGRFRVARSSHPRDGSVSISAVLSSTSADALSAVLPLERGP